MNDEIEKLDEVVRSEADIRENSKGRLENHHGRTEKPDRKVGQKQRTEVPDKTEGRSVTDLLVDLLRTTPGITQQKLSSALGVARSTLNLRLSELKNIGAIRRVGPDRGGHWEVVGNTQEKRPRTQS